VTVLSPKSAEEYNKKNYNERQEKTGRPVSPHVMIYAFPVVALSSIMVRTTGIILSLGCTGIASMSLAGGDPEALMTAISASSFAAPAKFAVSFPLVYHFYGGLRHALWDFRPDMITNEQVEKQSFILIGASVATTLGACIV
jgi:succinate dehydrogenase (ubiquinone) cytochrome b560 subunit